MTEQAQKVEFSVPKGFAPPAGSEGGKEFELVCSFKASEGGKLCMTKLGDVKMPGCGGEESEDEKGSESKPDYSEYAKSIQSGMEPQE
jgi:hypothetical protein